MLLTKCHCRFVLLCGTGHIASLPQRIGPAEQTENLSAMIARGPMQSKRLFEPMRGLLGAAQASMDLGEVVQSRCLAGGVAHAPV